MGRPRSTHDANEYDNEGRREGGRRSRTPVAAGRLNYSDPQTKQNGHIFGVKVDFLGFWDLMGSAYLEIQARGARTGAGGAARRGGRYAR